MTHIEVDQRFVFDNDVTVVRRFLLQNLTQWRYWAMLSSSGSQSAIWHDKPFGYRQVSDGEPPMPTDTEETKNRLLYLEWQPCLPDPKSLYQMYLGLHMSGHPGIAWLESGIAHIDLAQSKPRECTATLLVARQPYWWETKEALSDVFRFWIHPMLNFFWTRLIEVWSETPTGLQPGGKNRPLDRRRPETVRRDNKVRDLVQERQRRAEQEWRNGDRDAPRLTEADLVDYLKELDANYSMTTRTLRTILRRGKVKSPTD